MAEPVLIRATKKNGTEVAYYGSQGDDGYVYFNDADEYRFLPTGTWEDNLYVNNRTRRSWTKCKAFTHLEGENIRDVIKTTPGYGQGSTAPSNPGTAGAPAGGEGVEDAVKWAIAIANDNSHGYDQGNRWGPDYDCSSLVYEAFRVGGGFTGLPTHSGYTGTMINDFTAIGFTWYPGLGNEPSQLYRGDILLNPSSHTEIYIGGGQNVGAHCNEWGGITGGQTGDQTGNEISVDWYYTGWTGVLRYTG